MHPTDGSVFIAFTASSDRPGLWPNVHGEVWRLEEDGGDPGVARLPLVAVLRGRAARSRAHRPRVHPARQPRDRPPRRLVGGDRHRGRAHQCPRALRGVQERRRLPHPRHRPGPRPALAVRVAALRGGGDGPGLRARGRARSSCPSSTRASGTARGSPPRTRPAGSNWPSRRLGTPPQPAVVAMRRR